MTNCRVYVDVQCMTNCELHDVTCFQGSRMSSQMSQVATPRKEQGVVKLPKIKTQKVGMSACSVNVYITLTWISMKPKLV